MGQISENIWILPYRTRWNSRCSGSISDTETTYISFGRGETDALIRQAETARRSTEIHRRNASSENRAVRDAETQSVTSAEQRRLEEQKRIDEQERARADRKRNRR
ncbi:hypothetical protein DW958_08690 [Ruminococcus sp. AM46-18]|nr:hypothetical protein DW999_09020 [Ruminococcus sp. AM54-14NS]RHR97769.1 hypothetical protein DWW20_18970 [Ruminococcus sp. AF14-5]RHS65067.1 hypothetical protein DW958_08690 [Ruminococcus sp. AM46-18]